MNGRSWRQPQTSIDRRGADEDPAQDGSRDPSIFYANLCLGFFPVGPLDFLAFAKGQLMALAIFVPATIGLFIFLAS